MTDSPRREPEDSLAFPPVKGFGLDGFDMPGDCSCPDLATLDPGCPEHGTKPLPVALPAAEDLPKNWGTARHRVTAEVGPGTPAKCTCPGDPSASAAGWNPSCPVHGETEVVERFGKTTEELAKEAEAGYAIATSCDNDSHALGCPCHQGGPIMVDIPPAVGESERQRRIRETRERLDKETEELLGRVPPPQVPERQRLLDEAARLISIDRQAIYGPAIDDFTRTGRMWAAILGLDEVTAEQVALCMTAVKIGRLCHSPDHADSWTDGIGYLALGGDIADEHRRDDNTARQR